MLDLTCFGECLWRHQLRPLPKTRDRAEHGACGCRVRRHPCDLREWFVLWDVTLEPGTYYAVVDGETAPDEGGFVLNATLLPAAPAP